MTMIGSPACPLGRLEGQARGGGEGEGRCRLSSPPPKGATPCDRPPRGAILIPRPLGVVDYSTSGGRSSPGWSRAWGDGPRRGRRAAPLRRIAGSRRTNAEPIEDRRQGTQRPPPWSIPRGCGGWRGTVDIPVPQVNLGFSYDAVYEITAPADITFLTLYSRPAADAHALVASMRTPVFDNGGKRQDGNGFPVPNASPLVGQEKQTPHELAFL